MTVFLFTLLALVPVSAETVSAGPISVSQTDDGRVTVRGLVLHPGTTWVIHGTHVDLADVHIFPNAQLKVYAQRVSGYANIYLSGHAAPYRNFNLTSPYAYWHWAYGWSGRYVFRPSHAPVVDSYSRKLSSVKFYPREFDEFGEHKYLAMIRAPEAWALQQILQQGRRMHQVTVGVVDSGTPISTRGLERQLAMNGTVHGSTVPYTGPVAKHPHGEAVMHTVCSRHNDNYSWLGVCNADFVDIHSVKALWTPTSLYDGGRTFLGHMYADEINSEEVKGMLAQLPIHQEHSVQDALWKLIHSTGGRSAPKLVNLSWAMPPHGLSHVQRLIWCVEWLRNRNIPLICAAGNSDVDYNIIYRDYLMSWGTYAYNMYPSARYPRPWQVLPDFLRMVSPAGGGSVSSPSQLADAAQAIVADANALNRLMNNPMMPSVRSTNPAIKITFVAKFIKDHVFAPVHDVLSYPNDLLRDYRDLREWQKHGPRLQEVLPEAIKVGAKRAIYPAFLADEALYGSRFSNVIPVMACGSDGRSLPDLEMPGSPFITSNYGDKVVALCAPGFSSRFPVSAGYANRMGTIDWMGTSMATAIVSGVAAGMYTIDPTLTTQELRNILINSVVPAFRGAFRNYCKSGGVIDAYQSMLAAYRLGQNKEIMRQHEEYLRMLREASHHG